MRVSKVGNFWPLYVMYHLHFQFTFMLLGNMEQLFRCCFGACCSLPYDVKVPSSFIEDPQVALSWHAFLIPVEFLSLLHIHHIHFRSLYYNSYNGGASQTGTPIWVRIWATNNFKIVYEHENMDAIICRCRSLLLGDFRYSHRSENFTLPY